MKASLRCYHSQTEYRMQPGRVSPVRINEHFLFGAENTMASDVMIEFTDGNFQAEAMESDVPVLVDFWAEWCQPCKMLAPTIEELAGDYAGRVKIGKLDVDGNKETAMNFSIQSIPTVVLLKGGEVVGKFVGMQSKETFATALDGALA
jgi:thioredoxin 1